MLLARTLHGFPPLPSPVPHPPLPSASPLLRAAAVPRDKCSLATEHNNAGSILWLHNPAPAISFSSTRSHPHSKQEIAEKVHTWVPLDLLFLHFVCDRTREELTCFILLRHDRPIQSSFMDTISDGSSHNFLFVSMTRMEKGHICHVCFLLFLSCSPSTWSKVD